MTFLWPGRAVGGSRPSRVLKALLTAAMMHAAPDVGIEDPDGGLAAIRARIAASSDEVQGRIREVIAEITSDRATVNLSRWARALSRSADRVGLLLCADPAVALAFAASGGAADAAQDLLDYALTSAHLEARDALALSICI
jgi:hypothetical protein